MCRGRFDKCSREAIGAHRDFVDWGRLPVALPAQPLQGVPLRPCASFSRPILRRIFVHDFTVDNV